MDLFAKRAIQVSVFGVPGCSSRLFPPFLDFLPLYGSVVLRFEIFLRCTVCLVRYSGFFSCVQTASLIFLDFVSLFRTPERRVPIFCRCPVRSFDLFRFFRLHDFQRSVRLPVPHSRCVWRPPARTRGVSGPGGRDSRE